MTDSKLWIAARYWAKEVPRRTMVAWYNLALRQPKAISAMVRIRNEEEFLYASVKSIVEHVEEVVLIDNLSTDRTPEIIRELCAEHKDRVVAMTYPHELFKYGRENDENRRRVGKRSPRLLANYYNWCLARSSKPYVIKWDADMVATDDFCAQLELFRARDDKEVLMFAGTNVHLDMVHRLARIEQRARVEGDGTVDDHTLREYIRPDAVAEPRLFPKAMASYDSGFWFGERLLTPFFEHPSHILRVERSCYLHLKYCKRDPYGNMSSDLRAALSANLKPGDPLDDQAIEALRDVGLKPTLIQDAA